MVKLIIRDDDLNYFSRIDDLEKIYEKIDGFPISFAVIPLVKDVSTEGKCSDTRGNTTPRWFGDNIELANWLKKKLELGKADCLMHGITHEFSTFGEEKMAEFEWRKSSDLTNVIIEQKKRLENILNYKISVFVAPRNVISRNNLKCITNAGLNYSGIVPVTFQRDLTFRNVTSYIQRMVIRAIYKFPYPGLLKYSDHLELNACVMQGYDYLVRIFQYCNKRNLPMAINVHYWHIRDNVEHYKGFYDFIYYALDNGAIPTRMSDVFNLQKI